MQVSVILKTMLVLMMVTLLFEANCLSTRKKGNKEKKNKNQKSHSHGKAKKMKLYVDPAVRNQLNELQIKNSLSPWTYETTFNNSRIPNYISEARCETMGCLNEHGREDSGLQSKPIFYQILVLWRVKRQKKYIFKLEKKIISVGCTCVRPHVFPEIEQSNLEN